MIKLKAQISLSLVCEDTRKFHPSGQIHNFLVHIFNAAKKILKIINYYCFQVQNRPKSEFSPKL